jgi:hypothetical protein
MIQFIRNNVPQTFWAKAYWTGLGVLKHIKILIALIFVKFPVKFKIGVS